MRRSDGEVGWTVGRWKVLRFGLRGEMGLCDLCFYVVFMLKAGGEVTGKGRRKSKVPRGRAEEVG